MPISYFPDLSEYSYGSLRQSLPTLNVGWLSSTQSFPTGKVSPQVLADLWKFCLVAVYPERGFDSCPICNQLALSEWNGDHFVGGSAQIRVFDRDGKAFAAPDMIYHYVAAHEYAPPPVFVDALLTGPRPPTQAYSEMLRKSGVSWGKRELNNGVFRFKKLENGDVVREWIVSPKKSQP